MSKVAVSIVTRSATWAILIVALCALSCSQGEAATASAGSADPSAQALSQVDRLLAEADSAEKTGNLNLALIQLKNAALLQPTNGNIRARLGLTLLQIGQAANAERELRQAWKDYAPENLVVPAILSAMLQRREATKLLAEFPDPPQGSEDKMTPDILAARAEALQMSGRPKDARAAMNRGLVLRPDAAGLVKSASLAEEQGDHELAISQADEAVRRFPDNEDAWVLKVTQAGSSGDAKTALMAAEEFMRRAPHSSTARILRIEALLASKNDAKAQEAVDSLLAGEPKAVYGQYFSAMLLARRHDFAGAWHAAQSLPPEFVMSRGNIAKMVAWIAQASGNAETGGAILSSLLAHQPDDRAARLQLATLRVSQKSPQAAITVLEPLKKSNDVTVHALLAQAYLALGRFDEAIASLELVNASPRASPLLEQQLALLELRTGGSSAIEQLRDLQQRDPENQQVSEALIAALAAGAKWEEALAAADRLAKRAPASPLASFYRGHILAARGDLAGAALEFSKALARDPNFVPALYYRANTFAARGDYDKGARDLQLIVSRQPANWLAYSKLIEIAIRNGRHEEALALYDRVIKVAPKSPVPRLALANYLVNRGKLVEAQAAVAETLKVVPDDPDAIALQGHIQLLAGRVADAVRTFRILANRKSASASAYDQLAGALYVARDFAGAEQAAQKAISLEPRSLETHLALAQLQVTIGKREAALAGANSFVSMTPGPDADLVLADTLLRMKRVSDARALLEKSLAAKSDNRIALRLSEILVQLGDRAKTKKFFEDWIHKNPMDIEIRNRQAAWLMGSGDSGAARAAYEVLLKLNPDNPIALNNLGALLQKDDPPRALALATLAARIAPASPQIADTLGWIRYLRGDQQGALAMLQRAHDLQSANPAISYHFAVVLRASGKLSEARSLLQTTLAGNPQFNGADEARQALASW
jgi:putative PEP-CTERM system TPR-repeat lipoprotein